MYLLKCSTKTFTNGNTYLTTVTKHNTYLTTVTKHNIYLTTVTKHNIYLTTVTKHNTYLTMVTKHNTYLTTVTKHNTYLTTGTKHNTYLTTESFVYSLYIAACVTHIQVENWKPQKWYVWFCMNICFWTCNKNKYIGINNQVIYNGQLYKIISSYIHIHTQLNYNISLWNLSSFALFKLPVVWPM